MVAARMGSTSDPTVSLDTLGAERKQLGLNCAVVSIDPAGSAATVKYLSYKPEAIEALSELIGMTVIGHTIPRRLWPGDRVFHESGPIWLPQPRAYFRHMFPHLPGAVATQAGQWLGIGEEGHICLLPLRVGESVIGAMPIWGKDLRPADSAALAVFGSQVAGILNAADALEAEARRADELARSNGIILALSKVAARLDSTAPFKEVVDTFGRELKSLGIDCVVGTFDDHKEILRVQYMSISEDVIRVGERLTGLTLSQLTIPRDRWPTDKVVTERLPYWDPQAMRGTLRMLPILPEPVHRMLLRAAGVNLDDPTCYLPLAIDEDVIGVLSVWGSTLRQNDLPALSVFASQLATAIKNTRLLQQAQERLEERTALLNEKEVLLKEVHHRVKNNLQVVSSLMNLQSAQVDDPRLKDALRESQNRVRTMALIHEKLYQSADLAQIDIAGYLHTLVNFLSQSYRERASTVVARVEAENIKVDIETAIPCGLIVNELVSNALKHAFPDGRSGEIRVCVTHNPAGKMLLSVSDSGVGFPVGLDHTRSPSLGLNLVNTLVAQIGGTLSLERTPGTRFSVTFNGAHAY
jgi:two-component sensor histidine kinase